MDYIKTAEGIKLSYSLSINDTSSQYLVILVHGTCAHKNALFFPRLAEALMYNTLSFDMEGNGQSDGKFMIGGFSRDVENIRSVVVWARSRSYHVLALIGHSKGGNEVIMYSSRYGDVPLIIPIAARMDMGILPSLLNSVLEKVENEGKADLEIMGKIFTIDKEGILERRGINMKRILEKVKTWTFVLHGSEDQVTHVRDSQEIESCIGRNCFERHVVQGAEHMFNGFEEELICAVNGFFKKTVPLLQLRGKI